MKALYRFLGIVICTFIASFGAASLSTAPATATADEASSSMEAAGTAWGSPVAPPQPTLDSYPFENMVMFAQATLRAHGYLVSVQIGWAKDPFDLRP
ncbi:MAG: hypothetical protein K6T78_09910 [Alicyclobacillus sp.]|nr:hypothetical protein [Alicyclobacillus sp.]